MNFGYLYKHPAQALVTQGWHNGCAIDLQTRGTAPPAFISVSQEVTQELIANTREGRALITPIQGTVVVVKHVTNQFRDHTVGGYGNYIDIQGTGEDASLRMRYAHLHEIFVELNATVVPGQVIGTEGDTGNSTGQHLHLECRNNGVAFDPRFGWFNGKPPTPGDTPPISEDATLATINAPTHQLATGKLLNTAYSYPFGPLDMCGIYGKETKINYGYAAVPGSTDYRRYGGTHRGCDSSGVKDEEGRALHTPAKGIVRVARSVVADGWGKTVVVEISSTEWIRFAHMSYVAVSVNDTLNAGDYIGQEGTTGQSTGIHLHFEYCNAHQLSNVSSLRYTGVGYAWGEDPFTWITGIQSHEAPWNEGWQTYVTPPTVGNYVGGSDSAHTELPPELYLLLPYMNDTLLHSLESLLGAKPDLVKGVLLRADDSTPMQHHVRTLTLNYGVALGAVWQLSNESPELQVHRIGMRFQYFPLPFGLFTRATSDTTNTISANYEEFLNLARDWGYVRQGYITDNAEQNNAVTALEPEYIRPIVMYRSPDATLAVQLQSEYDASASGMVRQDTIYRGIEQFNPRPPLILLSGGVTADGRLVSADADFECAIAGVSENQVLIGGIVSGGGEPGTFVDIPASPIGTIVTFMSYRNNGVKSTQRKLIEHARSNGRLSFEAVPGAQIDKLTKVDDRYVIATINPIGGILTVDIGDYLDVKFTTTANGEQRIIKCILGEWKSINDYGANIWGNDSGKGVIEVLYDYAGGFTDAKNDPWGKGKVDRITKVGNYGNFN